MNLRWTKTRPKKEGHYWYKDGLCDSPTILRVYQDDSSKEWYADDGLDLFFSFDPKEKETDETRWSSAPIPLPQ